MPFLDWLKSYLPESEEPVGNGISSPLYPKPTPSVPPEALSFLGPQTPSAPQLFSPMSSQQMKEPLAYHDTFMRTPDDVVKAKAAEQIRQIAFPQEQKELMSPAPLTPMRPSSSLKQEDLQSLLEKTSPKKESSVEKPTEVKKPVEEKKTEEPKTEDELLAAQRARSQQLGIADIMEGLAKAGTAVATRGQHTYQELSPDAFKGLRERAGLGVQEVKERREAKEKDLASKLNAIKLASEESDLHSKKELDDYNSDATKLMRDVAKRAAPGLKVEEMNGTQIKSILPNVVDIMRSETYEKTRLETAKINAEFRKQQKEDRDEKRTFEQQERYQKALSKVDADHREATAAYEQAAAEAALAKTNDQAAKNLPRLVIKAMEGKGARVSDADFKTAVGSEELGRKLYDTYTRVTTGNINALTQKEISDMMLVAQKIQNKNHQKAVKAEVERFAKRANVPVKEAAEIGVVDPNTLVEETQEKMIKVISHGVPGSIPESKLEEAMKRDPSLQVLK